LHPFLGGLSKEQKEELLRGEGVFADQVKASFVPLPGTAQPSAAEVKLEKRVAELEATNAKLTKKLRIVTEVLSKRDRARPGMSFLSTLA
jgi:hypothetical protein